jgi:hypothetical protein
MIALGMTRPEDDMIALGITRPEDDSSGDDKT